jgi:hypothetical protein
MIRAIEYADPQMRGKITRELEANPERMAEPS